MSEFLPEPLFSNVPRPESRPWKLRSIDAVLILILVLGGLIFWYWYGGRQERADEIQQKGISQKDLSDLDAARADADNQDTLWRLIDFPKRTSPVPPESDAAALLQASYDLWSSELRTISDANRYLALTDNSFLSLNSLLSGKVMRGFVGTHYDDAFPCNRKIQKMLVEQLQFYDAIFEPSRRFLCQAAHLKQGTFPSLSREFFESLYGKQNLSYLLPAFTGAILYQHYQAQNMIPTLLCQQAILEWSENKREAWEELRLIIDLAVLPDRPCPDNLHYLVNGCHPVFTVTEWMLGQRVAKEADLIALQKQLEPLLRQSRPLKTSLLCFRALVDHYAQLYASGVRDIKKEFGDGSAAMRHNVFQAATECIRFTTAAVEKLDLPLADFDAWYSQKIASYPGEAVYQAEPFSSMTPQRFFRVMFIPHLKTVVQDYYYHQEGLRLTLAALACERYRLTHQQFPENPQQLHASMTEDVWIDLFGDHGPIQLHLYPTPFGMAITTTGNAPADPKDWESRVCMNEPGYYVRIGFRL